MAKFVFDTFVNITNKLVYLNVLYKHFCWKKGTETTQISQKPEKCVCVLCVCVCVWGGG